MLVTQASLSARADSTPRTWTIVNALLLRAQNSKVQAHRQLADVRILNYHLTRHSISFRSANEIFAWFTLGLNSDSAQVGGCG